VRELVREPEAVFWVFVFPILLAAILGLAFRSRPPDALPVAVVEGPRGGTDAGARAEPSLKPQRTARSPGRAALVRGRVVLVVSAESRRPTPTTRRSPRAAPPGWRSTPRCSAPRAAPTPSRPAPSR
jgi:hypothetical protein